MKNARWQLAFLAVVASLGLTLGSLSAFAVFVYDGDTAATPAQGCEKNCGDGYVEFGEDCDTALYGPYPSDVCPGGGVRYKSCGSDCKWKYEPASCQSCGNSKAEGTEGCDWGAKNGIYETTILGCGSYTLNTKYTCTSSCQFDYQGKCSTCGNSKWESPEDCDWGPNGKEGVGATTICPDGTVQRTDCSGSCKWVKVPAVCKPPFDCTVDGCPSDKVCNTQTKQCEPKPDSCSTTAECSADGKSIVTKTLCKNAAGTLTKNEQTSSACGADMLCAKKSTGTGVECVRDCSNAWTCSAWSPDPCAYPQTQARSCVSKYTECANTPQQSRECPSKIDCLYGISYQCTSSKGGTCTGDLSACQTLLGIQNPSCTAECNTAVIVSESCSDGAKNQGETGTDCGGPCAKNVPEACDGIDNDKDCSVDEGCGQVIVPESCSDGAKNQNEAGVDCGGVCATTAVEACDGLDNDKDCQVDEGGVCTSAVDQCLGIDPDSDQICCEQKGYKWAKPGEEKAFGGFSQNEVSSSKAECVGDDSGEYYRFRECEGSTCTTDLNDFAACRSQYSCLLEGKCYTRLDRTLDEEAEIKQKVDTRQQESGKAKELLDKLAELHAKVQAATTTNEKREVSNEIANVLAKLEKLETVTIAAPKEKEKGKPQPKPGIGKEKPDKEGGWGTPGTPAGGKTTQAVGVISVIAVGAQPQPQAIGIGKAPQQEATLLCMPPKG